MSELDLAWAEIEALREDLEAAKQREAELASALEIARTALNTIRKRWHFGDHNYLPALAVELWEPADQALDKLSAPSTALAERDRAIEKRTAERCAEIASSRINWEQIKHVAIVSSIPSAAFISGDIRREFNLEPKPEGE